MSILLRSLFGGWGKTGPEKQKEMGKKEPKKEKERGKSGRGRGGGCGFNGWRK